MENDADDVRDEDRAVRRRFTYLDHERTADVSK